MTQNWDNIKWIFEPDGWLLRDIYIQDVSLTDWKQLIDFLNCTYNLKFGEEDLIQIDKEYVINYLTDNTGEIESKTLRIDLDGIDVHCYFFLQDEIEFDIVPKDIKSFSDFGKLEEFMTAISKVLKKQITLTGENDPKFPLIKIDYEKEIYKILTKQEAKELLERQNSILTRLTYLKTNFMQRFLPTRFEKKLLKSASEVHKSTNKNKNVW